MRRKYEKPQVTEVRLTSEEVLLTGCKRENEDGWTPRQYVCGWAVDEPCYTYSAASGS